MITSTPAPDLTSVARPWMVVVADTSVLTEDDGTVRVEQVITNLADHHVAVVLASTSGPADLYELQGALTMPCPFVSDGGTTLHIPGNYFETMLGLGASTHDWHVIEFARRSPKGFSAAIDLLLRLYWERRDSGLVVAVTDRHADLLKLADIPIIVRNPRLDQRQLREQAADAYVTNATGYAGWTEGILGPLQ
jgi:predicted mannosyl-3-phosphoglycerate phosphatase (HAD superfamily)